MNEGNEREEGNKILREQLEFYKNHECKIHLELKNGRYYNGLILELAGDLVILHDDKLGAMPIYFIEIGVLERWKSN